MRIALVYDCLYPNTIGGAERWYRNLGEWLDGDHHVTYLTRRQWGEEGPQTRFETIAVSPGGSLYTASGRRGIAAPLRFGLGIFWHLLRHAGRYDAVHTASFPYFSVLGAALALRLRRSPALLVIDWHELWTGEYWRSYLGPLGGRIGMAVQALCVRLPDRSFTFSRLVEQRLRESGGRAPVVRLTGEYVEPSSPIVTRTSAAEPPLVLFAGRHIPEKRVRAIPPAIAAARRERPGLRCQILGDGPETPALRTAVADLGLADAIEVRGRVGGEEVDSALAAATCLLHPSEREGYGLVVVEACARGTPAVLVAGSENAAVELVEPGVNGFVAASAEPEGLARAILACIEGGEELRRSTLAWYAANRRRLSLQGSLAAVEAAYAEPVGGAPASGVSA
jgi:glycosyltransferase involved in cell wall biosynthesis